MKRFVSLYSPLWDIIALSFIGLAAWFTTPLFIAVGCLIGAGINTWRTLDSWSSEEKS